MGLPFHPHDILFACRLSSFDAWQFLCMQFSHFIIFYASERNMIISQTAGWKLQSRTTWAVPRPWRAPKGSIFFPYQWWRILRDQAGMLYVAAVPGRIFHLPNFHWELLVDCLFCCLDGKAEKTYSASWHYDKYREECPNSRVSYSWWKVIVPATS